MRRRRRRENSLSTFFEILKFYSTFFEIFEIFVGKNAIKSDFWGVVGRYISKISKEYPFWGKMHLPSSKNFLVALVDVSRKLSLENAIKSENMGI